MPGLGSICVVVNRKLLHVLVLFCACAVTACGSTTVSDVSPSGARCGSTLTGLPGSISGGGGQFAATITTARECTWGVESDSSWLQISPSSGQGETAVSVVVAENPTGASRTASLTVSGTRMSVRQEGATCRFSWNETSSEIPASGGTVTIGVSAIPGCAWQASASASWLRGTRTSGTGDGSAEFAADPNPGAERAATLRVGDASMTVTQFAAGPPAPPPSILPLIATYRGTASGTHNFDVSGGLSLAPGSYTLTFNGPGTIYVRGVAGGGGGGGGKRRDDLGMVTTGGGAGGGGAASLAGQPVSVLSGVTYEAVVGSGGSGGAGATSASGNVAQAGGAGGQTSFRAQGGAVYLQLNGGAGGSQGETAAGAGTGGRGGTVAVGIGVSGGDGGNGGAFTASAATVGSGTSGAMTGGGGGGGSSSAPGVPASGQGGAAGGASGGGGGNNGVGGNGFSGATDSGAGGEGAVDANGLDSAGGGGGGGKGITVSGGPANRGGGGGGGGAINTGTGGLVIRHSNATDRGGNGGAGGPGGMSIGIR